jgi:hypothetical protein
MSRFCWLESPLISGAYLSVMDCFHAVICVTLAPGPNSFGFGNSEARVVISLVDELRSLWLDGVVDAEAWLVAQCSMLPTRWLMPCI